MAGQVVPDARSAKHHEHAKHKELRVVDKGSLLGDVALDGVCDISTQENGAQKLADSSDDHGLEDGDGLGAN